MQLGMGSALETLCGQAYGAGRLRMLGVYMQRSWVILLTTACLLVPIYVFAPPILELIGETTEISEAAGQYKPSICISSGFPLRLYVVNMNIIQVITK